MSEIFCNSCFKTSISSDGVSCYYCGSFETRRVFLSNLYPPVPKLDNACAEYYIPNGCFFLSDTNTANVEEGSMLLDQASTPTKDIDFNSYVQNDQRHVHEKSVTNECLSEDLTCNTFDQDSTANRNPLPMHPSKSEHQPGTKIPLREILDEPNDNQPILYPDIKEYKTESVSSTDDFLTGPSGLQKRMKMSKLCEEKLQFRKFLETHSSPHQDKKVYTCRVCNEDIHKHPQDGDNYKCCFCPFQTSERANLQMHSYDHRPASICDICGKEYIGDSHNKEQTCVMCKQTFRCRTWLREHYLDHGDYFRTHCWICCHEIRKHIDTSDENQPYVCCICGYKTHSINGMNRHNVYHKPKIFCKICKEEFVTEEEVFHDKVFSCFLCEKTFKCKTQLEDHLVDHQKYLSTNCYICKREASEHRRKQDGKTVFECCQCSKIMKTNKFRTFRSHLFPHINLRSLKCDSCRRRFSHASSLSQHSQICTNMPYKCEICGVGFDNKNSLNMHRSKIHN